MYIVYLYHTEYLDNEPKVTMPFLPTQNDWIEVPLDLRKQFWPGCAETLYVVEREHLFDENMTFYGTRLHLQDWEGN